jgi:CBS domain containing-hemolysin-like protein
LKIRARRVTFAGMSSSDELRAAAATRRELGRDYDEAILLSLADRVQHARRRPTVFQETVTMVIALGSIGLGILVALAAAQLGAVGGTFATIVAWICIAAINIVHARSR